MTTATRIPDRRTSVDEVFDDLYARIVSLRLRPGDKISEAEVAARFGVSRQPVRDAFSRLANLDLLLIRPQRATIVRRFSLREVKKARFVRAAIEAEVLRRAAAAPSADASARLDACLDRQRASIMAGDYNAFGLLDYEFHETICDIAGVIFAFEAMAVEKAKVDRLCLLSLAKEDRMPQLLEDHIGIAEAIKRGDVAGVVEIGMLHLSRLDETIEAIVASNGDYFEPD
ncbi:GntR family transcriptional regulator [Jannaschia sp.]|nr:GntR family transcriptional regulator [Jannaschia sp.]